MEVSLSSKPCPCGSKKAFKDCCGLYIEHKKTAPNAEALMRSRYTAYTLSDEDYLLSTWHPSTRPMNLGLADRSSQQWQQLNILFTEQGQNMDSQGVVAFIASYIENSVSQHLCEKSRFEKINGCWFYLDGEMFAVSKNGPCPCDSGKKFKRCCGK